MTRCWPFIRLILRRAQVHALPRNTMSCCARLEGWGGPHGSRRRARGLRNLGRHKIAAPHHEAGRDRECIKLIGSRFSVPRSHWTSIWYRLNLPHHSASPVAEAGPSSAPVERRLARRGTAPEVPRQLPLGQWRGVLCALVWGVARVTSSAAPLDKAALRRKLALALRLADSRERH